jgi:hypothetical protein
MANLYEVRKKLIREGAYLRVLAMDNKLSKDKTFEIRKEQDKQYKKYQFLDGFLKARDRVK